MRSIPALSAADLEIIAFDLNQQSFCVLTNSIREIRGWATVTPLPRTTSEILGVMNLRGSVIPIIDLAAKLGMPTAVPTERSAIVVAQARSTTVGLMVDRVSDILSVSLEDLQPVPAVAEPATGSYAIGVFNRDQNLSCLLDIDAIFASSQELPQF